MSRAPQNASSAASRDGQWFGRFGQELAEAASITKEKSRHSQQAKDLADAAKLLARSRRRADALRVAGRRAYPSCTSECSEVFQGTLRSLSRSIRTSRARGE